MLAATPEEADRVTEYMNWQAPDLTIEMIQKVYSENVLSSTHDVWDVHTNEDRWWVITEPMNLYSQTQFPNMDLALTFHIGLCLRIPMNDRPKLHELPVEPFGECFRYLYEASDALRHSHEVGDYQAVGVRCREALLAFVAAAQTVLPWTSEEEQPQKANLKAWADHICAAALAGASHENRRHLFKTLLDSAWKFVNWLTHTKASKWHDAEAGVEVTESAISLCTSVVIRQLRKVPEECPACGSHRLSPQRGFHEDFPDCEFERPTCDKCGWLGEPVLIEEVPTPPDETSHPEGECVVPTVPLRKLLRPRGSPGSESSGR